MDANKCNDGFQNKLVCINYPGYVENVDKMLETLGGMKYIEHTVGTPQKKLELKFRPENLTCKPTIADKDTKPGILLKITIPDDEKAKESDGLNGGYKYEIEGITALTFKFNKLVDFQYLPLATRDAVEHKDSTLEYIYDKIVPKELPDLQWFMSEESKKVPEFILPPLFSRTDGTQKKLHFPRAKYYDDTFQSEYANKMRSNAKEKSSKYFPIPRRNKTECKAVNIQDKTFPTEPFKSSLTALNNKQISKEHYEDLKKMFEERPIWSKSACQHKLGLNQMQIRTLLPLVGYYFLTGPWRIMWARYGYDPRKDPESRKYQTFDFRIRTTGGLKMRVEAKRNYVKGESHTKKVSLKHDDIAQFKSNTVNENDYILRPNMIPPARQMFYQYCDIQLPEIQAMLTRLPPVPHGTICDEKNGWLPSSFTDQCREIAYKYVYAHVQFLLDQQKDEEKASTSKDIPTSLQQFEISDSEDESENEMYEVAVKKLNSDESESDNETEAGPSVLVHHETTKKSVEEVNKMLGISTNSSSDEET